MSQSVIDHYRARIKRMGRWMAPRFLRNRGFTFEQAYFIIFGVQPRL
ncbi:hypothetical protein [Duganella sp. FT27W]|nr:hypothetical protein [Duganella sp. FT27W]